MTPTPPRGFIKVEWQDAPIFIRASEISGVEDRGEVYVMLASGSGCSVSNSLAEVLAAIDAAAVVEQNGVAASFMVKMLDQLAKQAKA
jgi:hypothetical protein